MVRQQASLAFSASYMGPRIQHCRGGPVYSWDIFHDGTAHISAGIQYLDRGLGRHYFLIFYFKDF